MFNLNFNMKIHDFSILQLFKICISVKTIKTEYLLCDKVHF